MDSRRIPRKPKLLICPYDNVHRIEEGTRYQRHLIECGKNHPDVKELICPFNRTHRVKAHEMPYHMNTCPDNYVVQKEIIQVNSDFKMKCMENIEITKFDPPPNTEDWEQEQLPEPITINTMNLQNNKQIKFVNSDVLSGLKPKQKKKFRKNLGKEGCAFKFDDDSDEEGEEVKPNEMQSQQQQQKQKLQPQKAEAKDENIETLITKLKIRTPSVIPVAVAPPLHLANAGRGLNPGFHRPRIAANIFGSVPEASNIVPSNNLATAGIGRGQLLEPRKRLPGEIAKQMADAEEEAKETIDVNNFNMEESNSVTNDNFKLKRKLEKKLKQIELLEVKIKNNGNGSLNMEEVNKVKSKSEIIENLQKINKYLEPCARQN